MRNLECIYDSRKDFGDKAKVNGNILFSYDTKICEIKDNGDVILTKHWSHSATTLRHLKEFLKQKNVVGGSATITKKDILKGIENGLFKIEN